jgi:hypothetical protein
VNAPAPADDDLEPWKARLMHRRYTDEARLAPVLELSARIEHLGTAFYFPLGSEETRIAAAKACQIHEVCMERGWDVVRQQFAREIALAVLWNSNPFACTYTTLITELKDAARKPSTIPPAPGLIRVGIVEPESGVRRALARWIDYNSGFRCVHTFKDLREAEPHLGGIDLLLFHH